MKKKFGKLLTLTVLVFCCWTLFGLGSLAEESRIPEGVVVEGIDLSNMTSAEAVSALNTYVDQVKSKTLHLTAGEDVMDIPFSEIGVDIADASVIDSLSKIGTGGNVLKRYKELSDVKNGNATYKISFTFNQDALRSILNERSGEINRAPQDASIVRHDGQLILSEGLNGRALKVEDTAAAVAAAMNDSWDRNDLTVAIVMEETAPAHTTEELAVIDTELGSYSTNFAASSYNRVENIKNGASKIDETVLYPGDVFSFTEKVAPFTSDNGYYMAGAYASGKTIDSMGGGICQVSSTLYNAVLRAELTILERTNHMMTVGYVPLGADATIAEPTIDFKFRNDYDYPVYIESYTYNGYVTVAVYGKETRPSNRTIEFESVTEQTISPPADVVTEDPSQPEGYEQVTQSAHTGYVAAFYKLVYVDGVLESRELLNRSTYQAYPRYVTKGTKAPETEPPQTDAPVSDPTPTPNPEPNPPQTDGPQVEEPTPEPPPEVPTEE